MTDAGCLSSLQKKAGQKRFYANRIISGHLHHSGAFVNFDAGIEQGQGI